MVAEVSMPLTMTPVLTNKEVNELMALPPEGHENWATQKKPQKGASVFQNTGTQLAPVVDDVELTMPNEAYGCGFNMKDDIFHVTDPKTGEIIPVMRVKPGATIGNAYGVDKAYVDNKIDELKALLIGMKRPSIDYAFNPTMDKLDVDTLLKLLLIKMLLKDDDNMSIVELMKIWDGPSKIGKPKALTAEQKAEVQEMIEKQKKQEEAEKKKIEAEKRAAAIGAGTGGIIGTALGFMFGGPVLGVLGGLAGSYIGKKVASWFD